MNAILEACAWALICLAFGYYALPWVLSALQAFGC